MSANVYREVVVTHILEEARNVKTFSVVATDDAPITYVAGQFLTFVFNRYGKEERRSFSISSSPVAHEPLSFTVKRLENGAYSCFLIDEVRVGDRLSTTGAAGLFTLPDYLDAYEQLFFFAAGIGITPVFSLIKTLLYAGYGKKITLVYSNRTIEDTVFYGQLQQLRRDFEGIFAIEYLFSSSRRLDRARLSKWLLPILLSEFATVPRDRLLCYICGPYAYMRMATLGLEEEGFRADQIRKEHFNTNDHRTVQTPPPDKGNHMLTLTYKGRTFQIEVAYPDTILQAARKNGIVLPYSCEVGRCGSCVALCTAGKVWLSYNEVLTDADIKNGRVLTCTGHPVGGDVSLQV
jgi:ferredoxin-NADP reductase